MNDQLQKSWLCLLLLSLMTGSKGFTRSLLIPLHDQRTSLEIVVHSSHPNPIPTRHFFVGLTVFMMDILLEYDMGSTTLCDFAWRKMSQMVDMYMYSGVPEV